MWNIYNDNGINRYTHDTPETSYFAVKRVSPIPNKVGFIPTLHADYEQEKIWWTLEPDPNYVPPEPEPEPETPEDKIWNEMAQALKEGVDMI